MTSGGGGPGTLCQECRAEAMVRQRPSFAAGLVRWLGSGGRWRPAVSVCGVCGASAGGAGWAIYAAASPRWWTMPLRVVRSVLRTVETYRSVQPVPWTYLSAALVGGTVAGAAARSRCPVAAGVAVTAAGAAGGALVCWAGFAWTARGTTDLGQALLVAALQEVSPRRAERRRRAHRAALAATAPFVVYGPVDHLERDHEVRDLYPTAQGRPPVVTAVLLVHGDPGDATSPWLMVTSRIAGDDADAGDDAQDDIQDDERAVAERLHERATAGGRTTTDRAAAPPPGWLDADLEIDGRVVTGRLRRQGRHWGAVARVGGVRVVVEGHDTASGMSLRRMSGFLDRYAR